MSVCKKGVNVVNIATKTINLAKDTLNKPTSGRCPPKLVCPQIQPPPITQIRVCTPEQLKSICPADPCVCPEPPKPLTGEERLFNFLVIISKWLFLLGFIKWTNDLGVWGNIDSTMQLVDDAKERLSPVLRSEKADNKKNGDNKKNSDNKKNRDDKKGGDDKNSSSSNTQEHYYGFTYNLATIWNSTISTIFYVVGVLPITACNKVFDLVNSKNNDESPPPSSPPPENDKKSKKVHYRHYSSGP